MPSISPSQALALRRAGLTAAALGATLAAHALTTGALPAFPVAPAIWGMFICVATLCGPRAGTLRPRGPLRTLAVLLAVQAGFHLAVTAAPWAFGLHPHHQVPLVTGAALVGHVATAVAFALLLAKGEVLLAALIRVGEAVQRLLLAPRPARRRVPPRRLDLSVLPPHVPLRTAGTPVRGPPLTV